MSTIRIFATVLVLFTVTSKQLLAQTKQLVAKKNNRVVLYEQGKRYSFFYLLTNQTARSIRGSYTSLSDSTLVIAHKNGLDTVPVQNLLRVYNHRSFLNITKHILQIGAGVTIVAVTATSASGFVDILLLLAGTAITIDRGLALFGSPYWLNSKEGPSVQRGFQFSIAANAP